MSDVFLGYDAARGRHVAVKLLADHLAADPGAVRRFTREARLSRSMTHPALVCGLGSGVDGPSGRHFLTLEYVDGPNALGRLARGGPLPLPVIARIAADVGAALRHLHGRSLIHRDVKPDNILLCPDGSAKLADLGLTRRVLPGQGPAETGPAAAGTPHYMPPEQTVSPDRVDPRSDLYALGATLYHLLTGTVPFDGGSQDELLQQKLGGRYRLATAVQPTLPGAVDVLMSHLLASEPADRYQTAGEFLAAARDLLGPLAPLTETHPVPEPTAEPPGDEGDTGRTHIDIPAVKPPPGGRAVTGLLLLAAVLATGLAARWASPQSPASSRSRAVEQPGVRTGDSVVRPIEAH